MQAKANSISKIPTTSITTKWKKSKKKEAGDREFQTWLENMLKEDAGIIKALAEI